MLRIRKCHDWVAFGCALCTLLATAAVPPRTAATCKNRENKPLGERDGERSISLPLRRIVAKDQSDADPFHLAETLDHLAHSIVAESERRQHHLFEHLAHITGVRRQDIFAFVRAYAQRLMARRMPVRGQANHATVTEQVVFAIDQLELVGRTIESRRWFTIGETQKALCQASCKSPGRATRKLALSFFLRNIAVRRMATRYDSSSRTWPSSWWGRTAGSTHAKGHVPFNRDQFWADPVTLDS